MRNAVVCLVNYERARYHLPRLLQVHKLNSSAQRYTAEMVRRNFFSHTAPNGSTPGARIAATGYHWSWAGENIASGYATPLSVVTGWMHSQGHCYNMLAPTFRNIGVGVSPHPVGYATTPSTWTQDFGLPMGAHSPSGNWGPANSCPH
ncbi:MAG TPA: CAP domain-containing protein [Solirubrobacteraceae bacterium]|nr:CAP domain-containing protein [Solirubrobacteraceae bacterium]